MLRYSNIFHKDNDKLTELLADDSEYEYTEEYVYFLIHLLPLFFVIVFYFLITCLFEEEIRRWRY